MILKKFESDLTNFLKQKFGFDFIFFTRKDKEKPYGYVLIDHNKREVYKGSDLLKLDLLIANATIKEQSYFHADNGNEHTKLREVNSKDEISTVNNHIPEIELGKILNDFIDEIERENYQGDGRRKKRSNRTRRGYLNCSTAVLICT